MSIRADVQRMEPGSLVELFVLDTTPRGFSDVMRFTPSGPNELGEDIRWAGDVYTRYPIEAEGFDRRAQGTLPRPKLRAANISGLLGALALEMDDLVGCRITRTRTFARYLDAANFVAGNPEADPNQYLDKEIWWVDRKSGENPVFVEWELAAAIDLAGVLLPRRQYVRNLCSWRYRGPECGYAGGPVATFRDIATGDPAQDVCGKRLTSCQLRFTGGVDLPFGGFPSVGVVPR